MKEAEELNSIKKTSFYKTEQLVSIEANSSLFSNFLFNRFISSRAKYIV